MKKILPSTTQQTVNNDDFVVNNTKYLQNLDEGILFFKNSNYSSGSNKVMNNV